MNRARSFSLVSTLSLLAVLTGCQGGERDAGVKRTALTVSQTTARVFAEMAAHDTPAPSSPAASGSAAANAAAAKADAPGSVAVTSRPRATSKSADAKLKVRRLVVAQGVEKREPIGATSTFSAKDADKIYGFVELENPEKAEGNVYLSFEQGAGIYEPKGAYEPKGNVKLAVGASPRWRTWGYSRAVREAGTWSVVVRDEAGTELARERFEVTL